MADQPKDAPKLHIDDDWKSQAQAEKQKLAEKTRQEPAAAATATARPGQARSAQLPPADFRSLVSSMATQALFSLGAIPDPTTGQRIAHLDLARHHIDMLAVIADKTQGNLNPEETKLLNNALYELRTQYVNIARQLVAQAQQEGIAEEAGGVQLG